MVKTGLKRVNMFKFSVIAREHVGLKIETGTVLKRHIAAAIRIKRIELGSGRLPIAIIRAIAIAIGNNQQARAIDGIGIILILRWCIWLILIWLIVVGIGVGVWVGVGVGIGGVRM